MITRRRLLQSGGWVAGGATAVATSPASAFNVEEPSAALAELYHASNRCSADAYHRQLIADVDALFAGQSVSAADKEKILASLTCPICGCSIVSG